MTRKYFPFDKNYLLREAQNASRDELLSSLVNTVKDCYQAFYNPLGLIDDTVQKIQESSTANQHYFEEFYDHLAAIYRYKFGEVQLEFLWDGSSHHDKYAAEWETAFDLWVREFCKHPTFVKAVFELTVFFSPFTRPELAQNRLKVFLSNHFELKVYHYKGIVETRVA